MVVEDESITAKDIESSLKRLGYRVPHVAHSGEEALEKAASVRPDLVLMDVRLKGKLDGIQTAEQLRRRFGIPVTYLTAYADDATLARAQAAAPFGYLLKPFNERELHATIQMALHCRRLERQAAESQGWLSSVLGAVGDGIIATDGEGHIRFMNAVAENLTGWSQAEAIGRPLGQVFRTGPLSHGPLTGNRRPHIGDPEEVLLLHRTGREIPIEVVASTVNDESGEIAGFVWAFRDITARKRAERELREKEEYFRSLIEQTSDIITVVDQDGTVHYVSPSVRAILGYEPADILGKSIVDHLHPEDARATVLALSRLFSGKRTTARLDVRVRHQDRSWRVMEVVGSRKPGLAREPRIILSSRDVTDRKKAEARLREELEASARLVQMGQEMMAVLGTRDLLQDLCRITTQVLQCEFSHTWLYDESEQTYVAVAGYGDTPEMWESVRALRMPLSSIGGTLLTRTDEEGVTEFVAGNAQDLVPESIPARYGISSCLYMALRRQGRMVGIHTAGYRGKGGPFSEQQRRMARRIAHLASLALEHARLLEELDGANQLKSDLIATLSHELRTPLATIVSVTQLLLEEEFGPLSAEQTERLQVIDRTTRQMVELIQTTLDLGRAERRQTHLDIVDLPVADLVAELQRESETLPKQSGVDLRWEIEPGLSNLMTDRMKLKVILKNLLGNALKFTQRGEVTVSACKRGEGIEFAVSDTGPGIPPDARTLIFQPYRQVTGTAGEKRKGIGLGLYIVRQLLDMIGGSVELESEVGCGSRFRVWIPFATPAGAR